MKGKEIFNHVLVNKHEIMPKNEVDAVKKQYNAELEKFPKIYVDDPTAKAIDAKVGDLIRIIRPSPTTGTTTYYRYVIPVIEKITGFESDTPEIKKEELDEITETTEDDKE